MSLESQLAAGVRGLDIRVNRAKMFIESDFSKKGTHYYCKGDEAPLECWDFLLMSDFLPLYSMSMY